MLTKYSRLWICALLLGGLFDYLFYKHSPGISFAVFALVVIAVGALILFQNGIRPAKGSLVLLPFLLFFAVITFIRREPVSVLLAHGFSLLLMAGLAVTYRGGQWFRYGLEDFFMRAAGLLLSLVTQPVGFLLRMHQEGQQKEGGAKKAGVVWPVVRGVLIAIPVLAFFASLLGSADEIFNQRLNGFVTLFRLENLPELIFQGILICVAAYAILAVYLHAAERSTDEKLGGQDKPTIPTFLGFIESSIVLGSVALLFAAFVLIQFQYFFGGQANIHLEGFTYAEYARKGFGELVGAAFFALLLHLGLATITRKEGVVQRRIFTGLGVALLALVGVMLVSAYQRLVLYEEAYGFTRLRIYTHVFMIWVAVLLAALVVMDFFGRQRMFALSVLLMALGFAASLGLLNVDQFVFERDLARAGKNGSLDAGYLGTLSADAVPAMVRAFQSAGLTAELRESVGVALLCLQETQRFSEGDQAWQAFTVSRALAVQALQPVEGTLQAYKLDNSKWPTEVTAPGGTVYLCGSNAD